MKNKILNFFRQWRSAIGMVLVIAMVLIWAVAVFAGLATREGVMVQSWWLVVLLAAPASGFLIYCTDELGRRWQHEYRRYLMQKASPVALLARLQQAKDEGQGMSLPELLAALKALNGFNLGKVAGLSAKLARARQNWEQAQESGDQFLTDYYRLSVDGAETIRDEVEAHLAVLHLCYGFCQSFDKAAPDLQTEFRPDEGVAS